MDNIIKIYILFIFLAAISAVLFTWGCKNSPDERPNMFTKMDAPLRLKLAEMERTNDRHPLSCLVEFEGMLDTEGKEKFEATGVTIMSVIDNIATVEGDPDSIIRCAGLEFVRSISLSMVRKPLE